MTALHAIDWLVILGYFILVFGIAWWAYLKEKQDRVPSGPGHLRPLGPRAAVRPRRVGLPMRTRLRAAGTRPYAALVLLVVAFGHGGCGGGDDGTAATPVATPTPVPVRYTVAGRVTDRIDDRPITSSHIRFVGASGPASGTVADAAVVDGTYEIQGLSAGTYAVTLEHPAHITHTTGAVRIPDDGTDLPFTVIRWGTTAFGATYDETFDAFYRAIRGPDYGRGPELVKWTQMPGQIYVENDGTDPTTLARVLEWIREINEESIPPMFCGQTAPLSIEVGPALPDHRRDGAIVVWFGTGTFNYATPHLVAGRTPGSQEIVGATVHLIAENYRRNEFPGEGRCVVAHELFHAAYAVHAPFYDDTLMWRNCAHEPQSLSPQDKLASCIVYDPDTHPGNVLPDTNRTYRY